MERGIEIDGIFDCLAAFKALETDLRKTANGELRAAARECATKLQTDLVAAAAASGVPAAPLVAKSIRVKSDRIPVVQIGGTRKVGRYGAPAGALLWGSEHGPKGDVNHFGVEPRAAGYWITPTVKQFRDSGALPVYKRAVYDLMRKHRLV